MLYMYNIKYYVYTLYFIWTFQKAIPCKDCGRIHQKYEVCACEELTLLLRLMTTKTVVVSRLIKKSVETDKNRKGKKKK